MWLEIVVLSVVEGITEFLPISSTGHMIIAERLMGMERTEQLNAFLVIVQAGAILAVVSAFWPLLKRWAIAWYHLLPFAHVVEETAGEDVDHRSQSFFVMLAVVPFGIAGFLFNKVVEELFSIRIVASALITGGVFIWISDLVFSLRKRTPRSAKKIGFVDAVLLGCGQCLALWPGFSRSAATIVTGRFLGFSQEAAAELSFLIGLPTLMGAATYKMLKEFHNLDDTWFAYLGVGIVISWIVAYLCVKAFILFLQKYSMNLFAIYRIIVGIALLYFFSQG